MYGALAFSANALYMVLTTVILREGILRSKTFFELFLNKCCVYDIYNVYLYCCNEAINLNLLIMNDSLDILNNLNETFENDFCIINLITECVTWKPSKFNPKMSNNIDYWFNERKKLNS